MILSGAISSDAYSPHSMNLADSKFYIKMTYIIFLQAVCGLQYMVYTLLQTSLITVTQCYSYWDYRIG